MGKTLTREQYKESKFSTRKDNRKIKETTHYAKTDDDVAPKKTVKKKWQPHSEIEV